ncbi:MAG: PhzF family phenazine biosynthesis protein [Holosporales bacterium]|nr:PhzF family phenazine biosynthesis protein [Holosporales bacterium]
MFFLVDAFTDAPFLGNPAGVYLMTKDILSYKTEDLQRMATYFDWSEISYISRISENKYRIRWFSPRDEAPLCGHATLAAAHILFHTGHVTGNRVDFVFNDGIIQTTKETDSINNGFISMLFPIKPIKKAQDIPFDPKEIIGISEYEDILKDDLVYVIILKDSNCVRRVKPNSKAIKKINARAIIVTARGPNKHNCEYDFCSRYFAPSVGLYEDPVCGSAHCRLTPYWAQILNKTEMLAFQASERTGILKVGLCGDYVRISGRAVITAEFLSLWRH